VTPSQPTRLRRDPSESESHSRHLTHNWGLSSAQQQVSCLRHIAVVFRDVCANFVVTMWLALSVTGCSESSLARMLERS
jgi:hypothetical protein